MELNAITDQVIAKLGGQSAVARIAGVTQQSVAYWQSRSGRIPAEYVLAIEAALNKKGCMLSRYEIRPDVYGEKPKAA